MILNASPGCGLNFPKNSITLKNMINKIIKEGQPTPVFGNVAALLKFLFTERISRVCYSMVIYFFSGTAGFASFLGIISFKIPCWNSPLRSSSVTSVPT